MEYNGSFEVFDQVKFFGRNPIKDVGNVLQIENAEHMAAERCLERQGVAIKIFAPNKEAVCMANPKARSTVIVFPWYVVNDLELNVRRDSGMRKAIKTEEPVEARTGL